MSAPIAVPWTHRSCFIAWSDRAAAETAIRTLQVDAPTPFTVLGVFDGDEMDGDAEVYFGLDCDAFSISETLFIAEAAKLGGRHTGS